MFTCIQKYLIIFIQYRPQDLLKWSEESVGKGPWEWGSIIVIIIIIIIIIISQTIIYWPLSKRSLSELVKHINKSNNSNDIFDSKSPTGRWQKCLSCMLWSNGPALWE